MSHKPDDKAVARVDDALLCDLRAHLKHTPVDIVFDVGANVGQTFAKVRGAYPSCRIFCFEPVAATFQALVSKVGADPRASCHHLAFGASERRALVTARGTATGNRIVASADDTPLPVEETVLTTGDRFCREQGIERISFLKIDTEGLDLDVLVGFGEMLRDQRIDIIQVEASMNPTNPRHVPFAAFSGFLSPFLYYLFRIYEQVLEPKGYPILRRANPVFISSATAQRNIVRSER